MLRNRIKIITAVAFLIISGFRVIQGYIVPDVNETIKIYCPEDTVPLIVDIHPPPDENPGLVIEFECERISWPTE